MAAPAVLSRNEQPSANAGRLWRYSRPWKAVRSAVLRAPLGIKLAGANVLIAVLAWFTSYLHDRGVGADWQLLFLMGGVLAAGLVANLILLTIALRPIRALETTATRVWSGDLGARVPRSSLNDANLEKLARALNTLLDGLVRDRNRVRELTAEVIRLADRERANLARELQESLGQSLAALIYHLQAESSSAAGSQHPSLREARDIAAQALVSINLLSKSVYPRVLDDFGLVAGLRSLARNLTNDSTAVEVRVVDGETNLRQLTAEVSTALYRVAEEAVQNAIRHARARHIEIVLRPTPVSTTLMVTDDGVGFDQAGIAFTNHGIGLFVMQERAFLVNGTFDIESAPGAGTTVRVRVPCRSDTIQERPGYTGARGPLPVATHA